MANRETIDTIFQAAQPEREEMPLRQYLELVQENPRVTRGAHARMYDAIVSRGVVGEGDERHYRFFDGEIFGIDPVLNQIVDYFSAAAHGMDIRRRILLLLGPVSSAKSTIVHLLKRGYEAYARTPEGAMYGLKGCPHHEEPLHAVPQHLRKPFAEIGANVEGDLCPYCRTVLDEEFGGDISKFQVERIYPDEARRVGIATFAPADALTQDMSELIGSMDLAKLPKYGSEADARAYQFNGAINVASRGILELIEFLKVKRDLQYALLTLAQERMVKAGRFELFYVDEILIAHTNEAEFETFAADKKNEAIQNRIFIVRVPYNLILNDEVKIYQRMLQGANLGVHIAPNTLETLARWAVMTRYEESEKFKADTKLALYNGEFHGEYSEGTLRELKRSVKREGMFGVSPRQVLNALSVAVAKKSEPCVNPMDALRAALDTIPSHVTHEDEEKTRKFVYQAREQFDEKIKVEIEKAFVHSFEESAQNVLSAYLDNAQASLDKTRVLDPVTGEETDPDEKLMRELEAEIGISPSAAAEFRREVLAKVGQLARKGESFRWDSHPRLKEAIQKKLFSDVVNLIKVTTSVRVPDEEQQKQIDRVKRTLKTQGYCDFCADAVLKYVGQLLHR